MYNSMFKCTSFPTRPFFTWMYVQCDSSTQSQQDFVACPLGKKCHKWLKNIPCIINRAVAGGGASLVLPRYLYIGIKVMPKQQKKVDLAKTGLMAYTM